MARAFILVFAGALLSFLTAFIGPERDISVFQLVRQDLSVLILMTALLGLLLRWRPVLSVPIISPPVDAVQARMFSLVSAGLALLAGYTGARSVALHYPLSLDEFMVIFDSAIIRGGHIFAPVEPEWLGLKKALQPMFMFDTAAPVWASGYLPVNAALHAAMSVIDSALTAPVLAALSIILLFDIVRKIWPGRPDAAVVAVLLLVTSSQFLLTATTPYAMTAHLAFNLLWLWLFLRNTTAAHIAALIIGFAATGLHQLAFHPIFVAPFILSLWLGRRWPLAALYTAGYAVIVLFWISWRDLLIADVASGEVENVSAFVALASSLVRFDPGVLIYMPRNLVRVIAWQNPFALVLFGLACAQIRRWAFPLPQLLAGIVLTLVVVTILVPYQGHGWGYRYLHGMLGSISIIAAFAWIQFTGAEAARMRGALIVCSVFALAILPLRAWQMRSFTEPYTKASAAIASADADFVFVDPADIWFGVDFARNDPYLTRRPKVLLLNYLKPADVERLCAANKIAVFDVAAARRYDVPTLDRKYPDTQKLRALMAGRGCGAPL